MHARSMDSQYDFFTAFMRSLILDHWEYIPLLIKNDRWGGRRGDTEAFT